MEKNSGIKAGFSSSKSKSETSQSTVVGSSATAGNNLNIVARGDNANDAHNGDLTVTAGNTQGSYTNDVNSADGHLENNFDANQLQNSQLGMQLVGEVMGQVSDALYSHQVCDRSS
ncbi:hemagglutinin repeat-containing protein [Commensalibacter nepenthis]|uniref:Hemagglutinin repeat-containing protein n=1 Tax=Commensalibacter nepenthis TaxID=3043872 RepID=A0ABT6QA52_9PROT|nr:hemagglutinin repeat-containing protein [Commensalibacter sp. TBRC 10068]MDI2113784.1 hemagglutinin repeat-containing protein [Commensalibacter sp. TBRC 10068]